MGRRSGSKTFGGKQRTGDPYIQSRYGIDLVYDSTPIGSFGALSGGEMEMVVTPYSLNDYGGSTTIYIPGTYGFTPLIFTRGVSTNMAWWNWWTQISEHEIVRKTLTVYAYGYERSTTIKDENDNDKEVIDYQPAQWTLTNAWPSKISGLDFSLGSDKVYVASVTLIVEGVTRVS